MFRREFLRLFSGMVAAGPLVARAQLSAIPVVGYLDASSAVGREAVVAAFRDGLKQMRFVEGYTLKIEYRWADNNVDRLADLIADLVRHEVSALLVAGNIAAQRAHAATKAVPVVFVVGNDPIKLGLVESLSHPGGNITGITPLNADLGPKRLQIVRELAPTADVI